MKKIRKFRKAPFLAMAGAALLITAGSLQAETIADKCNYCHDVANYERELKASSHVVDKDKKVIGCDQCHVPHFDPLESFFKSFGKDRKLVNGKVFQPGELDRRRMQDNARRFIPADKCLKCHADLTKNTKGEKISEVGRLCHEAYEGKNGNTRRTCAGCHMNIAHLPDWDRRLMVINADFNAKLPVLVKEDQ